MHASLLHSRLVPAAANAKLILATSREVPMAIKREWAAAMVNYMRGMNLGPNEIYHHLARFEWARAAPW